MRTVILHQSGELWFTVLIRDHFSKDMVNYDLPNTKLMLKYDLPMLNYDLHFHVGRSELNIICVIKWGGGRS